MKPSLERTLLLSLFGAVVVLLGVGGVAWWSVARYEESVAWVDHTHEVINRIEQAVTDVMAMQASARGFLITGRDDTLRPYATGAAHLPATLRELAQLTADNPPQPPRIRELETLAARATALWEARIAARHAGATDVAGDAATASGAQPVVDSFRQVAREIEEAESHLLDARFTRARGDARRTVVAIAAATAFAALLVVSAALFVRRDLRRRQAAEASLRVSQERLRLMIDSVRDYAIVMLTPEGRIESWNAGAHRIKGYTADEIIGQHFSRFYPEEAVRAGEPQRMLAVAAEQGRAEAQAWRLRKDGSQFWGDVIVTAVRDGAGQLIGYLKVTRDLTEQRRAQEKIEALHEDLRRRAAQLETANRELEAFSYSVSHDLRAPLRHIDGFGGLLTNHAGPALDAEGRRYLDTIMRAARQMGTLIDDLLAFSRIGRTPLRCERVEQRPLVERVIADGHFGTAERPIAWDVGALPAAWGDAGLLRQVWANLIDNAVKYSSRAALPRIAIGSHRDAATDEQVFFVRDNGVGFNMDQADKLFGVFQRLHSATEFEGTGIGLANVRRIVVRHGGRTWAEGRVGEGATFYFSLPARPPENSPTDA